MSFSRCASTRASASLTRCFSLVISSNVDIPYFKTGYRLTRIHQSLRRLSLSFTRCNRRIPPDLFGYHLSVSPWTHAVTSMSVRFPGPRGRRFTPGRHTPPTCVPTAVRKGRMISAQSMKLPFVNWAKYVSYRCENRLIVGSDADGRSAPPRISSDVQCSASPRPRLPAASPS